MKPPGGSGSNDPTLGQRVDRLEDDVTEIKMLLRDQQRVLTDIQVKLGTIDGRITGLEGRIAGLDAKISALPSTWTILGIVFTTWAPGSGILIFAMNFVRP